MEWVARLALGDVGRPLALGNQIGSYRVLIAQGSFPPIIHAV
jgi:hypothetical protein